MVDPSIFKKGSIAREFAEAEAKDKKVADVSSSRGGSSRGGSSSSKSSSRSSSKSRSSSRDSKDKKKDKRNIVKLKRDAKYNVVTPEGKTIAARSFSEAKRKAKGVSGAVVRTSDSAKDINRTLSAFSESRIESSQDLREIQRKGSRRRARKLAGETFEEGIEDIRFREGDPLSPRISAQEDRIEQRKKTRKAPLTGMFRFFEPPKGEKPQIAKSSVRAPRKRPETGATSFFPADKESPSTKIRKERQRINQRNIKELGTGSRIDIAQESPRQLKISKIKEIGREQATAFGSGLLLSRPKKEDLPPISDPSKAFSLGILTSIVGGGEFSGVKKGVGAGIKTLKASKTGRLALRTGQVGKEVFLKPLLAQEAVRGAERITRKDRGIEQKTITQAFEKAQEKEAKGVGRQIAQEVTLFAQPTGVFEKEVRKFAKEKGFDKEKTQRLVEEAKRKRIFRGVGEASGLLAGAAGTEKVGRKTFATLGKTKPITSKLSKLPKKAFIRGAKVIAPLGVAEATSGELIQRRARGEKVTAKGLGIAATAGGVSAGLLGGGIIGSQVGKVTGRTATRRGTAKATKGALSLFGNIADPYEFPGDVLEAAGRKGRLFFRGGKDISPTTTKKGAKATFGAQTSIKPSLRGRIFKKPKKFKFKVPSVQGITLVEARAQKPKKGKSLVPSISLTGVTPTPTPVSVPSLTTTQTTTAPTPTTVGVPSFTETPTTVPTNIQTPSEIISEDETPTETETPTPTPTPTPTGVPVFSPQARNLPPFFPPQLPSGAAKRRTTKGRRKTISELAIGLRQLGNLTSVKNTLRGIPNKRGKR